MNIEKIQDRNLNMQQKSAGLTHFLPKVDMLSHTSLIIRSLKKLQTAFPGLISAKSEAAFYKIHDQLEEEIDEVVYCLDKIQMLNSIPKTVVINDYIKEGYELLSNYSKACDSIIEKRTLHRI